MQLDGLIKLSLEGNELENLDFSDSRWQRVELLNISNNKLDNLRGLKSLASLVSLNLGTFLHFNAYARFDKRALQDNNLLTYVDEPEQDNRSRKSAKDISVLTKLRVLRLSGNRLKHLDAARFPSLRTLYVDNNCLAENKVGQSGQSGDVHTSRKRLMNLHRLGKLENFSARNQNGASVRETAL
jgi:protein NUD1